VTGRWILPLIFAAGSCTPASHDEGVYERASAELERGNLQSAETLVRPTSQPSNDEPSSASAWRLRLLTAEILLAQGKAPEAAEIVERSVSDGPDGDALEARRLKIAGHAALSLGRFEDAELLLESALRSATAAQAQRLVIELDVLRGLLLIRTNRQAEGESITRAAYAKAEAAKDAYWQAAASNNLGLQRIRAHAYDEAIPFLEQASEAARAVGAQRFLAASLANLGISYYRIGDFDKSLDYLQQAAESQERLGALAGLQSSLGEIGNVHFVQGRPEEAIPFFERALAIARSSSPIDAVEWARNLAAAHAEAKRWDEAERFNREALTLQQALSDVDTEAYSTLHAATIAAGRGQHLEAIRLYEDTIALSRGNAELTWVANAGLGKAHARMGARARATNYFERSLNTIEVERSQLARGDHKLTFFSRVTSFYRDYVDVLAEQGARIKALQVADSSRALMLLERLELGHDRREPVTAATLRQAARNQNRVFLSYWLAPERSFVWAVNGRTIEMFELPGRDHIAGLVDAYRQFIETSLRDPIAADFKPARELYDILLAPVAHMIRPGSQVTVVPDGPLHSLNLETLPVFDEQPHYFIQDATVTVAPALAIAVAPEPERVHPDAAFLVVGDPESAGRDFPRLAHAGREIQAIRSRFGADRAMVLSGNDATPAAYIASPLERFSVIHFAAHATANRASPLDSAVVLSPHESGYLLTARDVLEHRLQADLVTLSACRSAGARIYGGEGIVGFAWAFLQAGARSVVAGLWDVSDRSTSQLMEELYAGLHAGLPPAAALREAKLSLIRSNSNFANPYYWGPFQLYVGGGTRAGPPST
jgi:CHAT domain-containing protein/Tfp pilus assembly protein PilF